MILSSWLMVADNQVFFPTVGFQGGIKTLSWILKEEKNLANAPSCSDASPPIADC
jgi:hypothetical protein